MLEMTLEGADAVRSIRFKTECRCSRLWPEKRTRFPEGEQGEQEVSDRRGRQKSQTTQGKRRTMPGDLIRNVLDQDVHVQSKLTRRENPDPIGRIGLGQHQELLCLLFPRLRFALVHKAYLRIRGIKVPPNLKQ